MHLFHPLGTVMRLIGNILWFVLGGFVMVSGW
jgi:hypothetical protein